MFTAAAEFAMVSVGMFVSSVGVAAAVVAVVAFSVFSRLNRSKLLCIQQQDILNTRLKAKVASKAKDDQDKFFEVRDYLEHLVEGLVDGGLDDVCLTPLSTHPQYMSICWKYHEQLATTLTAAIHSIINESEVFDEIPIKLNKILEEVSNDVEHLPELQAVQKQCAVPLADDLNDKNYEDLLATAILNKIVSNSQTKKNIPNGRGRYHKVYPAKQSSSSASSSSTKKTEKLPPKVDKVSLTVKEFTEEVTTTSYSTYSDGDGDYDDGYNEGDEEDDERSQSAIGMFMSNAKLLRGHQVPLPEFGSDSADDGSTLDPDDQGIITATIDSWEDNWLFQKKRFNQLTGSNNYHHHPVPVPMLVPNPCEVTRPLIGDRDADETSELSDYSNSAFDELLELSDFESEPTKLLDDVDANSTDGRMTFESPSSDEDNPLNWDPVVEACNKHVALSQVDSGQESMDHQRDFDNSLEVNERPVPRPRSSLLATTDSEINSISSEDAVVQEDEPSPPRPGTIAEREHSKWEKAAPLPNNPYSAESIEKRKFKSLFGSRSSSEASLNNFSNVKKTSTPTKIVCSPSLPDTQRYGRDYYINRSEESKASQKQTKVSKLVVHIGQSNNPEELPSQLSGPRPRPTGTGVVSDREKQDKLVRVCSWSDRRPDGLSPKSSAAESTGAADDVHMPSVKELAKQFSFNTANKTARNPTRQVHSLTARSLSREYREGLGLKLREKTAGATIHDSDDSGNGSAKSEDAAGLVA